jgi:hypothetical protein
MTCQTPKRHFRKDDAISTRSDALPLFLGIETHYPDVPLRFSH